MAGVEEGKASLAAEFYNTSINKIMKGKTNLASATSFERINKAQTNRSTTKQTFSFSKGQRFLEAKP